MTLAQAVQECTERLSRVDRIVSRLEDDIQAWAEARHWTIDSIVAADRLSHRWILQVHQQPPLADWSYQFGEGVHNLRAALDNFPVAIARAQGVTDRKLLKQIQFPITSSRKEWGDNAARIKSLPDAVQLAIEQVQPFQRLQQEGESLESDALLLLRDLSNQDKHHARVHSCLETASIDHEAVLEFETEEGAAASVAPDMTVNKTDFTWVTSCWSSGRKAESRKWAVITR